MNENSIQKCRTCLKSSAKTIHLTKTATGLNPTKTYGELLKECAKLECSADYEHLMPQYLCPICCRELNNTHAFIKQAQYCNNKLINVISKQLDCLREKIIDLPEKETELKKSLDSKVSKFFGNYQTEDQKEQVANVNEPSNEIFTERLEGSEDDTSNHIEADAEIEIVYNEQCNSIDLPIINSPTVDINQTLENNTEELPTGTTCPVCGRNMIRNENLIKHMRTNHDMKLIHKQRIKPKETFACKLCSSKYTNKYTYLYHLKRKHSIDERKRKEKQKEKIIKCRSCDYTARTYAALNYHTRSKHGTEEDRFKCKFCVYMCLKKFDLLTHVKNFHKELIKILKAETENNVLPGESINDAITLPITKIESAGEDNVEEEFSSDDNIPLIKKFNNTTSHSIANIQEDREQFSDEEFIRNILNIKKRQTKSSTKSLARRCDECGNVYKNYRALYTHQKHVHISEDKYSLCPHCGKKYKRKPDLKIHIEKAHISKNSTENVKQPAKIREKRFMCTQCSYVCTTITILNIHINRHHTGEKPYKCDICFKSFIVPYDLKIHRYLHTGERPYKCPICSKGFRDNSHMVKHKRIHNTERPFKCKECSKSFTQSYNLSVHRRTHLKEKKLNCLTCGKVFENRSLLNLHRINEDHQDEVI